MTFSLAFGLLVGIVLGALGVYVTQRPIATLIAITVLCIGHQVLR